MPRYHNFDVYTLLECNDLNKKCEILCELTKLAHDGAVLDVKSLVDSLLYSTEYRVQSKILDLMSFLTLKHYSFKLELTNISAIYYYAFTTFSKDAFETIPHVLQLLTALSYQTNYSEPKENGPKGKDRYLKCHEIAKEAIRTSDCLEKMCMLFLQIDNNNPIWSALCESLTECCENYSENQNTSSHIIPKCVREVLKITRNIKLEIIKLLISLTRNNVANIEKFIHLGGMDAILSNLLEKCEGIELLYVLMDGSKLAVLYAKKNKIFNKLDEILQEHDKRDDLIHIELIHWITRTVLKFKNGESFVQDDTIKEESELNQEFKRPTNSKKRNCLDDSLKMHQKSKNSSKIHKNSNRKIFSETIRSKFDAVSSILNNTTQLCRELDRTVLNGSTMNIVETLDRFDENTFEFYHDFTPKLCSTPLKEKKPSNESQEPSQTVPNAVQNDGKSAQNQETKLKDTYGRSFMIENVTSDNNFGKIDNPVSNSFKVKQFVDQIVNHYKKNDLNALQSDYDQNYVCLVNPSDFITNTKENILNCVNIETDEIKTNLDEANFKNKMVDVTFEISCATNDSMNCNLTKIDDAMRGLDDEMVAGEKVTNCEVGESFKENVLFNFEQLFNPASAKPDTTSNRRNEFSNMSLFPVNKVAGYEMVTHLKNDTLNYDDSKIIKSVEDPPNEFSNTSLFPVNKVAGYEMVTHLKDGTLNYDDSKIIKSVEDTPNEFSNTSLFPVNKVAGYEMVTHLKDDTLNYDDLSTIKNSTESVDVVDRLKSYKSVRSDSVDQSIMNRVSLPWEDEEQSSICCKGECRELVKTIRQLKQGILHYGINFHIISKIFWPNDERITPSYLHDVFFTYIVKQ